jgi:hypothetical protein
VVHAYLNSSSCWCIALHRIDGRLIEAPRFILLHVKRKKNIMCIHGITTIVTNIFRVPTTANTLTVIFICSNIAYEMEGGGERGGEGDRKSCQVWIISSQSLDSWTNHSHIEETELYTVKDWYLPSFESTKADPITQQQYSAVSTNNYFLKIGS